MNRRAIFGLALGATLAPWLSTRAAGEASKSFRLAVAIPFPRTGPGYRAFEDRLRELGYQDGRNPKIDHLHFEDDVGRLSATIAGAVDRGADAILAGGPEVTLRSATAVTRTVPIVIVAIDYDPLHGAMLKALPGRRLTSPAFPFSRSNWPRSGWNC